MKWDDRVSRRVRLKDLHTLQTIAELGSMAKASTRLALSQPAISKAMADLEHTVGTPLLDRSAQGVELTECGRVLIERGRVIFDELLLGMQEIEHRSDPTRGLIRIGTTEPITSVVSDIICALVRRYPRITYHVNVSDTDTLARQLRERTLDVLVTRWIPPLIDDDLAGQVLFQNALAVMADKAHPLVGRKKLKLGDLMDEPWTLSPPDSFLGRVVVDVFRRRKLELPQTVVTTLSIYMRLGLLASGRFLTVLPRTMLRQRSNRAWLRALDIDLSDSAGPIALITLKRRRSASPLKLFEEAGRAVCRDLASGA
jgi:DNA-binding transcriptional LysR family regulator